MVKFNMEMLNQYLWISTCSFIDRIVKRREPAMWKSLCMRGVTSLHKGCMVMHWVCSLVWNSICKNSVLSGSCNSVTSIMDGLYCCIMCCKPLKSCSIVLAQIWIINVNFYIIIQSRTALLSCVRVQTFGNKDLSFVGECTSDSECIDLFMINADFGMAFKKNWLL